MSKHEFQTQVGDLLNLMIHSLYSNKEIFLRELISNASDALDKLNFLTLTNDEYKSLNFTPKIEISIDKEAKILRISDNGIGMNKDELIANLGTIARSGTKGFLENLSGDTKKDSNLIGQFGVGFYSAFMVANRVEVCSKKALENEAFLWSSDAKDFSISECEKADFGTEISLFLNDDEFLSEYRLENIIKKYSNHIPYPIYLKKEVFDENSEAKEDKTTKKEQENADKSYKFEQINRASALWQMQKSALKPDDYNEFYKQISHDSNDPLLYIHTKAEGTIEYSTLFFIPSVAPFDLYRADYESGVKLYVKRVFITDDNKELLPSFLRFVRGVMDIEDLPLNVSRELLQDNRILRSVKEASVKKILSELKNLKEKDREKYTKFYKIFGKVLKEGLYGFSPEKDELLELCLFKSIKSDDFIDLQNYQSQISKDQKEIFYISGSDENVLRNSPLLEDFKAKNIDVLICDDEIDGIVLPMIFEYKGLKFTNVSNICKESVKDESFDKLVTKIKESLKDDVKEVRLTKSLGEFAVCLTFDKDDPDFAMQEIMRQMGRETSEVKPILELNADSNIIKKLRDLNSDTNIDEIAKILLNLARISAGMSVKDPINFTKSLNNLISKAL